MPVCQFQQVRMLCFFCSTSDILTCILWVVNYFFTVIFTFFIKKIPSGLCRREYSIYQFAVPVTAGSPDDSAGDISGVISGAVVGVGVDVGVGVAVATATGAATPPVYV